MPNWCSNTLTLTHADPAMISRAKDAFKDGRLLDEFIPVPADLKETVAGSFGDAEKQAALEAKSEANREQHGYANWYDFCVNEWGTKWDVGGEGDFADDGDNSVTFYFDSAWAPPTKAYERLEEQGFAVSAMYYEPGMAFAGRYEDGCDDYYEYGDMSADDVENMLPNDIDEYFGISEGIRDWAESEEEDVPEIDDEETARAALDELKADYEKLMAEEESAENDQDKR